MAGVKRRFTAPVNQLAIEAVSRYFNIALQVSALRLVLFVAKKAIEKLAYYGNKISKQTLL